VEHPEPGSRRGGAGLTARRWLVDGTNVVGSTPDGWWKDRAGAFARLVGDLVTLGEPVDVVFDGRPAFEQGGDVTVHWARVADDRIVTLAEKYAERDDLLAVTSDRGLASRLRALGVEVVGVNHLRRRLRETTAADGD
jgi:hypothetical protein